MRLVIEAVPLIGRWSLSDTWQRDRAAWPPAPDTLFSALVAAAAAVQWGEHSPPLDVAHSRLGQALAWLETLGPPEVQAEEDPGRIEGLTWFVPVGDDAGLDHTRSRKPRRHNSVGSDRPVQWSWLVNADDADRNLPLLTEIAAAVTRIGSSRGPVMAMARLVDDAAWQPSLVPAEDGHLALRGVYPGRLLDLERWFKAGERPRPGPTLTYARPQDLVVMPSWGDILVLRKRSGLALDVHRTVDIAEAVRNALLAHLGDVQLEILTGHGDSEAVSRRDHLAIVPMARLGDSHADGVVLGVGLFLPRGTDDPTWHRLLQAVGQWMAAGGRLVIGGATCWTLELAADERRWNLNPERLRRRRRVWASGTPVVFDRHPKSHGKDTLPELVAAMCRKSGLPAPARIRASQYSSIVGALPSKAHALGSRDYLGGRYICHLELAWDRPVPGPILLGAGRYFGLGVMLPLDEPTADRAAA